MNVVHFPSLTMNVANSTCPWWMNAALLLGQGGHFSYRNSISCFQEYKGRSGCPSCICPFSSALKPKYSICQSDMTWTPSIYLDLENVRVLNWGNDWVVSMWTVRTTFSSKVEMLKCLAGLSLDLLSARYELGRPYHLILGALLGFTVMFLQALCLPPPPPPEPCSTWLVFNLYWEIRCCLPQEIMIFLFE